MGGKSTYLQLLCMIGFLSATWSVSKVSKMIGLPALVLEIGIGIALGPSVARLVGPEYAVCEQRRFGACQPPADTEQRVSSWQPIGERLGRIANMDYCPQHLYLNMSNVSWSTPAPTETSPHALVKAKKKGTMLDWLYSGFTTAKSHSAEEGPPEGPVPVSTCPDGNCANYTRHVPYSSYKECLQRSCEMDLERTCADNPDLFSLIGHAGVALTLFETGTYFSVKQFSRAGAWGFLVALVGATIPFLTGMGLTVIYGRPIVPDGVLAGTAMVPGASAFTLRLLRDAGVLEENYGQITLTAVMVDQLLALLLFDIFFSLGGFFHGFHMVASPIIGVILIGVTLLVAWKVVPPLLQGFLLPRVQQLNIPKCGADEFLYFVMFGWLVFYAWIMYLLGAFLWGCFMAGMSFACLENLDEIRKVWRKQTKPISNWLLRIFFACTVAFTIHPEVMFSGEAFWKGTVMGVFMGILFKVVSAVFLPEALWVVGWSMVGRGELAFFIAQMSASVGMMNQMTYVVVIWALLYATVISPYVFRLVLKRHLALPAGIEPCEVTGETQETDADEHRDRSLREVKVEDCQEPTSVVPVVPSSTARLRRASQWLSCLFFKEASPAAH